MPASRETLDAIAQFDTCTVANAIERFRVRLRNEGYTRPGLHAVIPGCARAIGYAATSHVRSAGPPMTGVAYADTTEWWAPIQRLPLPRVAVIQSTHDEAGASAIGEVHAAILRAFGCAAAITNGYVRDVPAVVAMGFPLFASGIALSHGYNHLVDYGQPVEIFGLKIHSGDLIYADCHGAISIPHEIADRIPEEAARIRAHERRIVDACLAPEFTPEHLLNAIRSNS